MSAVDQPELQEIQRKFSRLAVEVREEEASSSIWFSQLAIDVIIFSQLAIDVNKRAPFQFCRLALEGCDEEAVIIRGV